MFGCAEYFTIQGQGFAAACGVGEMFHGLLGVVALVDDCESRGVGDP